MDDGLYETDVTGVKGCMENWEVFFMAASNNFSTNFRGYMVPEFCWNAAPYVASSGLMSRVCSYKKQSQSWTHSVAMKFSSNLPWSSPRDSGPLPQSPYFSLVPIHHLSDI